MHEGHAPAASTTAVEFEGHAPAASTTAVEFEGHAPAASTTAVFFCSPALLNYFPKCYPS